MKRIILLLLILLPACRQEATTPPATADGEEMPADQIVYGLRHTMTTDGVRNAFLVGDTAYLHEQGATIDLKQVKLDFFDTNGRESGHLTSRTGDYNMRTGTFVAQDDVVLITQGPKGERRLETEELHYDSRADQLWSDVAFTLTEGGQVTRGDSFRSDSRFENLTADRLRTTIPAGADDGGIRF